MKRTLGSASFTVGLFALFCSSIVDPPAVAQQPAYEHDSAYWQTITEPLDQGWDYDTALRWYHADQGTAFIPLDWLITLERGESEERLASPGNLARFGFLPSPPNEYNPNGLPIGFSATNLDISRPPYSCRPGAWAGLTCAACHTSQIVYHGETLRIEGGGAQSDTEVFRTELSQALAATASQPGKLVRFATSLQTPPQELGAQLKCYLGAGAARTAIEQVGSTGQAAATPSGAARLDALGRGGNFLFAESTGMAHNFVPTTAPVSFPHLWDTPYLEWVLYNNSVAQPFARSVVEALGVGAPLDLASLKEERVVHHVKMDNLVDIHLSLMQLQSPKWPDEIFGALDADLIARGERIYQANCAGCHAVIDRTTEGRDPFTLLKVPTQSVEEIGTDPNQAVNFKERRIAVGNPSQPAPLGALVAKITGRIVSQYIDSEATPEYVDKMKDSNVSRESRFAAEAQYRARPLNGIWATAPFLHNGSVPDLAELLKPADERAGAFFVGNWEFDPEHVGFLWRRTSPGAFLFDTSLAGNSNAGHEYGTDLSADDGRALIEYLKSL